MAFIALLKKIIAVLTTYHSPTRVVSSAGAKDRYRSPYGVSFVVVIGVMVQ